MNLQGKHDDLRILVLLMVLFFIAMLMAR